MIMINFLFVAQVTVDINAILNDIQIMGNGLVKSIEVMSES